VRRRALLSTTAAVLLLGALVVWAVHGQAGLAPALPGTDGRAADGVREVTVRVYAWGFSPRLVAVSPGDTVRFVVVSQDIEHGFAINELGVNLQLLSGKEVRSPAVRVDLPEGKYAIHCSTFCGLGHPSMKASLVVGQPGPAPGARAPWVASLLSLAVTAGFAALVAGRRRPGA